MTRQLTITTAQWASAQNGTLWLVRDGEPCATPRSCPKFTRQMCRWNGTHPPAEFVAATTPCTARDHCSDPYNGYVDTTCPDCRIELVGSCLLCGGSGRTLGGPLGEDVGDCRCAMTEGLIVFGHAYAVGKPLPIYDLGDQGHIWPALVILGIHRIIYAESATSESWLADGGHLAHYGPPESLVGKWALRLEVVPS